MAKTEMNVTLCVMKPGGLLAVDSSIQSDIGAVRPPELQRSNTTVQCHVFDTDRQLLHTTAFFTHETSCISL